MNKTLQRVGSAVGASLPLAANAAVDVTAVVTEIGTATAAVALVAAAVFLVVAGIKAWKLSRRAM